MANRLLQYHLVGDILPFIDFSDSSFSYFIMASVGQGEIGDHCGVEGILAPPEVDDDPQVTLEGVGPPVMIMKEMRMCPMTLKMAVGAHIDLEELGVLSTL